MEVSDKLYIEKSIRKLSDDFVRFPNKYLTEDDVRIHLCKLLLGRFGKIKPTNDRDKSISLHTEVRWYGKGKLKYRSDIVLIDVATLDVKKTFTLPSKGYGFDVPKAIIELKFRRPNGKSDRAFKKSIKHDYDKLAKIRKELPEALSAFFCWIIAFDKKKKILNINIGGKVAFIYKFSNLTNNSSTSLNTNNS